MHTGTGGFTVEDLIIEGEGGYRIVRIGRDRLALRCGVNVICDARANDRERVLKHLRNAAYWHKRKVDLEKAESQALGQRKSKQEPSDAREISEQRRFARDMLRAAVLVARAS